jgi:hypothetical protein
VEPAPISRLASSGTDSGNAGNPAPDLETGAARRTIPQDETDERARYDWKSKYGDCQVQIWCEAVFVGGVQVLALLLLCLIWNGWLADKTGWASCRDPIFKQYSYFFLGGVLGGTLFGIKYLYHVVARGYWHVDRRPWRVLSPLLAGTLAMVTGALVEAGLLGLSLNTKRGASYLAIGFITGYFSDKALAKMTEIADVIFGTRDATRSKQSETRRSDKSKSANQPT